MKVYTKLIYVTFVSVSVSLLLSLGTGCASGREFWTYVVEPPVQKTIEPRQGGTVSGTGVVTPHVIKVSYSDGATATDVEIPVLSSGQQIIVDHKNRPAAEAVNLVPLAPTDADKTVEDAYVKSGRAVIKKAKPVSIVKTRAMVQNLVRQGNFSLALEYVEQVLQRYPQHAESLRLKGSLLLKTGEREAALEAYRKAEEIQPDKKVRETIREIEKGLANP